MPFRSTKLANLGKRLPAKHLRQKLDDAARIKIFNDFKSNGCGAICKGVCCSLAITMRGMQGEDAVWPALGLETDKATFEWATSLLLKQRGNGMTAGEASELFSLTVSKGLENPKTPSNPNILSNFISALVPKMEFGFSRMGNCLFSTKLGCAFSHFRPDVCWKFFCGFGKKGLKAGLNYFTPYEILISQARELKRSELPVFFKIINALGRASMGTKILVSQNPQGLVAEINSSFICNGGKEASIVPDGEAIGMIVNKISPPFGGIIAVSSQMPQKFKKSHDSQTFCYDNEGSCHGKERYNLDTLASGDVIRVI